MNVAMFAVGILIGLTIGAVILDLERRRMARQARADLGLTPVFDGMVRDRPGVVTPTPGRAPAPRVEHSPEETNA